ncbi:MAG: hypothetical protein GY906_27290 [bacterium]|nr:hypothetical protein [bacterium]
MTSERRASKRDIAFTQADVVVRGAGGSERTIQIMLRDESPGGIGGVYVGHDLPDVGDEYSLSEGGSRHVLRLAWWKKIAKYVLLIGFEIDEQMT